MNVAFFLDTPTFEFFFRDKLHMTKEQYVNSYQDDYSFLYVKMLNKLNVNVTLYLFSSEAKTIEVYIHKPTGCKIKFFPAPAFHKLLCSVTSRNSLLKKGFHAFLSSYTSTMSYRLLQSLKFDKPDIIYQQEYESGRFDVLTFLAKYLNIPLVVQYHGKGPSSFNPLPGFYRLCKKHTIRMAKKVLCISKDEYKRIQIEYGLSKDKVLYIPNPVETSFFTPRNKKSAKRYLGLDSNKKYILFVGRLLNAHKGITYLIDAFREVSKIHNNVYLLLVGTGPDERYLTEYSKNKGVPNIIFTKWIKSRQDLSYFYNASEFFICPSIYEAFGLVNLEAMASGLPVIGTNVGGIKDIVIDGKTGFLVQPKSSTGLSAKMLILLEDKKLSECMGKASRRRAEDYFSCDTIGEKLYRVFEEALAKRN